MIELSPELLLRAYAAGLFPMAESAEDPDLFWIDPDPRGVLPLDRFHLPRRLKRTLRSGQYEDLEGAAHRILNLRREGPKKNHVADDVRPTAMHEHGCENRDQVVAGRDLCRDYRPLGDERLAARKLKEKNSDVNGNDCAGYNRHPRRPPRRVA